jgi:hypothetical protein
LARFPKNTTSPRNPVSMGLAKEMGRRQSPHCRAAPRSSSSPQKLRTFQPRTSLQQRQIRASENKSRLLFSLRRGSRPGPVKVRNHFWSAQQRVFAVARRAQQPLSKGRTARTFNPRLQSRVASVRPLGIVRRFCSIWSMCRRSQCVTQELRCATFVGCFFL